MPLKLRIKRGAKVVINGAVVSVAGGHAASLQFHNAANILREEEVMLPEHADTPVKRIYFAIQNMIIDEDHRPAYDAEFAARVGEVQAVLQNPAVLTSLREVVGNVRDGRLYQALSGLRPVLAYERKLLGLDPQPFTAAGSAPAE